VDEPVKSKPSANGIHENARGLERALESAQATYARYRDLFDLAADGYVITDSRGIIEEANQTAADVLGVRKTFLAGKPLGFFMAGAAPDFYEHFSRILMDGAPTSNWETTFLRRNGDMISVVVAVSVVLRDGSPAAFRWLLRDVSARVRAEQDYLAEKSFGDRLMEAAQAIILVVDSQGRILRSNPYLQIVSGYSERDLQDRVWSALLLPSNVQSLDRKILGGEEPLSFTNYPSELIARDGSRRKINWSAKLVSRNPAEVLILGHDVTDQEEAQQKALQSERLAAIGQMVAGLAHESRNSLQRIQACLAMLHQECAESPRAMVLLDRAQKAQDDLHRLLDDVREYAAPIHPDRSLGNLAELWREAWDSLSSVQEGREACLREHSEGMDLVCDVDRFRLIQVFRNLFENALAACSDPVRIDVRCAETELGEAQALRIIVRDNGPGMSPEQKRRAFEPFYTSKNRGSGLGLAICRRVVEAHGGTIELGDGPGGEVIIALPRRKS
jgi:PAS domain S-box-containing protein